jgi:hypothetical protein
MSTSTFSRKIEQIFLGKNLCERQRSHAAHGCSPIRLQDAHPAAHVEGQRKP